ncbi:hypothetical protein [Corallococcus carmarthensis]|uniref:Latent transforming growth factor beta-binding protein n=1 Tax=Corallococcus carmarthensis TaxID=2316728 RepID=A0A3A8KCF7_9BACT|nr:hypothetical protein [Corallococcus carmarthensis]RKH05833.1 hypothetical protein D7X32_07000 [Corallococcus carmarthensis]
MPSFRRLLSFSTVMLFAVVPMASAEAPNASYEEASESRPGPICHESLCDTNQDCRNACPSALTAACVQNTCQFTYTSGGGGPGGPYCAEQFCSEDQECNCNGRPGYCGADSVCHF